MTGIHVRILRSSGILLRQRFWKHTPRGQRHTIADTIGIGGIFRGLRTIPVMVSFAREMQEVCPEALLLNYTNPMSIMTDAVLLSLNEQHILLGRLGYFDVHERFGVQDIELVAVMSIAEPPFDYVYNGNDPHKPDNPTY